MVKSNWKFVVGVALFLRSRACTWSISWKILSHATRTKPCKRKTTTAIVSAAAIAITINALSVAMDAGDCVPTQYLDRFAKRKSSNNDRLFTIRVHITLDGHEWRHYLRLTVTNYWTLVSLWKIASQYRWCINYARWQCSHFSLIHFSVRITKIIIALVHNHCFCLRLSVSMVFLREQVFCDH